MSQGSILRSSWAAIRRMTVPPAREGLLPLSCQAGRGIRDGPPLPPGASPIPAVLLCQHLAFVISCGLDSEKSTLPKKVGVLVQLGQSTQSPFRVILGSLPSFFLDCSWAWDGLWIFHVSGSGVGGDLGAGQVTCAHGHQDLLRIDTSPGPACLSLTLESGWGVYRNV